VSSQILSGHPHAWNRRAGGLQAVAGDATFLNTPILLLAASTDVSLGEQGVTTGATLAMRKPFGADAIVEQPGTVKEPGAALCT
jgi:hypothetical protein